MGQCPQLPLQLCLCASEDFFGRRSADERCSDPWTRLALESWPHEVLCVCQGEDVCGLLASSYEVVMERLLSLKPCKAGSPPVKHTWEFQLHA